MNRSLSASPEANPAKSSSHNTMNKASVPVMISGSSKALYCLVCVVVIPLATAYISIASQNMQA